MALKLRDDVLTKMRSVRKECNRVVDASSSRFSFFLSEKGYFMGQRLVVNIISNDEILASGYYHWSAYTEYAADITHYIISHIIESSQKAEDLLQYTANSKNTQIFNKLTAYLMLEDTGAGIYHKEIKEYEKFDVAYNYRFGENRNSGLIALTPEKIKEFNDWADGTVNIDISSDTVKFDVFAKFSEDEINNEITEEYINKYEIKDLDFEFIDQFTFEQCETWYEKIKELCSDNGYPYYRDKVDPIYYQIIA